MKIRPYQEIDFEQIQAMNRREGWSQLVQQKESTRQAWAHSNVAFVVEAEHEIVAYVRGLTDTAVSLYICELLVTDSMRRSGLGTALLAHAHAHYPTTRLELLANHASHTYYEQHHFRPFYGFRKTIQE